MVRFARTASEGIRPRGASERWSPAETIAMLRAVEPWGGPAPAGVVTVRDGRVEIRAPGPTTHETLVRCGRLAAALDVALRALGRVPRVHIADTLDAPVLVTISARARRAATARDLARRRAEHRSGAVAESGARRIDRHALIRVAGAAEAGGGRVCLLNGHPSHEGVPTWCPPGACPELAGAPEVPWARDPILGACTPGDAPGAAILAGIVAHRACTEAAMQGHHAALHPLPAAVAVPATARDGLPADDPAGADRPPWRVHALVHVHP